MTNKESSLTDLYNQLISVENYSDLSIDQAIQHLGDLIDCSSDLQKLEGLEKAIELANEIQDKKLSSENLIYVHYFTANAWDSIRQIKAPRKSEQGRKWEQIELEKGIFHLRSAINEKSFEDIDTLLMCNILTNYANCLDTIGRFIEAIEYWDRTLDINPDFGMALGNKAGGLEIYAMRVYDPGHQGILLKQAYINLNKTLTPLAVPYLYPDAKLAFEREKQRFEESYKPEFLNHECGLSDFPLGETPEEQLYRNWCLQNRLFLNPLNDLGPHSIAAQDIISTPNMVTDLNTGPRYQGFFNQMKQEFVSARYLYYEGIIAQDAHFSDKDVLLYNTLDYPVYCLAIEKVKLSFRAAYSLFDKIAYFLNEYLELGVAPYNVSFRKIWYSKVKSKTLRPEFDMKRNLPLRGLFWLSKDFFEDKPGFKDLVEPDAQNINEIRNHLEHKYLKLHEFWSPPKPDEDPIFESMRDDLAYSVERRDFEAKTMRLIKLARSALIYLSLTIHSDEIERSKGRNPNDIIAPMVQDTWEDDWKV